MNYIKITFPLRDIQQKEILLAYLYDLEATGIEELDQSIELWFEESLYKEDIIQQIAQKISLSFSTEIVAKVNWNEQWESNFEAVVIDDYCCIRADFHPPSTSTLHEIIITPKMSFGTGHHATTQLMIKMMKNMSFEGKKVLDFGTGTGILAIMAEKMNAQSVTAIDNDTWCIENTNENIAKNNCKLINAFLSSIENVWANGTFDIILANINRHILIAQMSQMFNILKHHGYLLLSGILHTDESILESTSIQQGFEHINTLREGNWSAMLFKKKVQRE